MCEFNPLTTNGSSHRWPIGFQRRLQITTVAKGLMSVLDWKPVEIRVELCRVDTGSGRSTSGRLVTEARRTTATVTDMPSACIPSRSTPQQTTVSPPGSTRAAPRFSLPRSAAEEEETIPILFVHNVRILANRCYLSLQIIDFKMLQRVSLSVSPANPIDNCKYSP